MTAFYQLVTNEMTLAFGRERLLFQSIKDPDSVNSLSDLDGIIRVYYYAWINELIVIIMK